MEEIKKIAKELETFVAIPSWQMEKVVYWWNSLICNFGLVSIGDVIDFFKSAYLIDDMEMKPKYYKWGFTEGLVENKNFMPCESISGRWIFTIKLPEIKDLTNE